MSGILYTRAEHIRKLQAIRDAALKDDNFKVGLSAEIAVGKAAGLYENLGPDDPAALEGPPPESMSTDELKASLQKMLPAPGTPLMEPEVRQKALDRLEDDDGGF